MAPCLPLRSRSALLPLCLRGAGGKRRKEVRGTRKRRGVLRPTRRVCAALGEKEYLPEAELMAGDGRAVGRVGIPPADRGGSVRGLQIRRQIESLCQRTER